MANAKSIAPTGIIFYGVCDVRTERCKAEEGGAVTAVKYLDSESQINVCNSCLHEKLRTGEWRSPGRTLPGSRQVFDIAATDASGNVQAVFEIKNWRNPSDEWLEKQIDLLNERIIRFSPNWAFICTPTRMRIFSREYGHHVENNMYNKLRSTAERIGLSMEEIEVRDRSEFKTNPPGIQRKHMLLEKVYLHLIRDAVDEGKLADCEIFSTFSREMRDCIFQMEFVAAR